MNASLHRPPAFALVASLVMLAIGSAAGGVLVMFQDSLYAAARREIVKRPEVHGFAGPEVIDEARIAEVADQSNTALRLLHTHALGIGILIFIAALAIANLPVAPRVQSVLCILVSLGALYPLGWLTLAWLIPYWGVDALRRPIEWIFFLPFGGALVIGLFGALGACLIALLRRTLTRVDRG
jgi:hypothetical protein